MKRTFAPSCHVVIMSAVALMVALTPLGIAGCGGNLGGGGGGGSVTVSSVTASVSPASVTVGLPSQASCIVTMSDGSSGSGCTFASSNATVASINAATGAITTKAAGSTTITATSTQDVDRSGTATLSVTNTVSPVAITATGPAIMARDVASANYVVTATVTGSANTGYACSSKYGNFATVDLANCEVTPSSTNPGTASIIATSAADSTKEATVSIQVGEWMLLGGPQGLQFYDGDRIGAPITIFTHADILQPTNGCDEPSVKHDLTEFVCENAWSAGPSIIDIYKTNGTAAGTTLVTSIDFTLAKYGSLSQVLHPSWSPDGENILFVSVIGNVQSIYTIAADGTKAPVKLFDEPPSMNGMFAPHYTPDGKSITFQKVTDNTVWIMGADGANPHQLMAVQSEVAFYTKDMKTIYYSGYLNGFSTFVAGDATALFPGYLLLGISPDEKSLLLLDLAAGTYLGSVQGGTPTKIGTGGLGSI